MYDQRSAGLRPASTRARMMVWTTAAATLASGLFPPPISAQQPPVSTEQAATSAQQLAGSSRPFNPSVIQRITGPSEKIELTTNSNRILTLDMKIPRVQVNNPELLVVTPLSDREIQISAKKAGVTQINLWGENGDIHSVDVLIYGDARELEHALQIQFPNSSIRVYRYTDSLVLKGFVDRPDYVSQIMRLAEDYAPKVINNITVGGVQQILLKVQVMEVSRTKLRRLGVDFAQVSSAGAHVGSSVSGLISSIVTNTNNTLTVNTNNGQTFQAGIVDGGDTFFAFLDALQQNNIAKVLAEPNLVAVSGRPAQFNAGGEIPILVPQSLGTASIEYKKFGTQVDFLPIVLGNGNIRLEVRPRISELDDTLSVTIDNFVIPGLTVREVDTAVEMRAGQTFALAGLIQERVEGVNRGLPFLADVPVLGVPFRKVEEEVNEVELLILVTPEFVDAMDPCEVPCGRPGFDTVSPSNSALYCGGHLEVPTHCNPIRGPLSCGEPYCGDCGACTSCGGGAPVGSYDPMTGAQAISTDDGVYLPGGTGYDYDDSEPTVAPAPPGAEGIHGELSLPDIEALPSLPSNGAPPADNRATRLSPNVPTGIAGGPGAVSGPYTTPRPYSPQRAPLYLRNAANPQIPNGAGGALTPSSSSELIGPVGYDVQ